MLIHFDNVDLTSNTGPNTFGGRLANELFARGHRINLIDGSHADISLVFIAESGQYVAPKVVQRLDGFWSKPSEFATRNRQIQQLYSTASAVVFQSDFDHQMVLQHFGVTAQRAEYVVINNGVKIDPVKTLTIPRLIAMRASYDKIYVCAANWHPQKRLSATVALFKHLQKSQPNSCLIVLGNNPDYHADPHIFYAGSVRPEVYNEIYSAADYMLHLAYGDHCPNTVVEALAQGTPVVCSEVGGTKELVGDYGVVLQEQTPFNFELYDYDNPPALDVTQVTRLPTRAELNYQTVADIDIKSVAEQYVRLFERVLGT